MTNSTQPKTAIPGKLISVVWEGITITDVSAFRTGHTVNQQYFFELKLKPPVNNSPFKPGIDSPESFNEKPVTLNFQNASGTTEQIIGNIIKLTYLKQVGQQPEIIIGGTIYRPSNNIPKFSILTTSLFLLPLIFLLGLSFLVYSLQGELIKVKGNVIYFKDDSYKGFKKYTFKVNPFKAKLFRKYDRPMFNTPVKNIDALFMSDYDGYHKDSLNQPVQFYVFKDDSIKLRSSVKTVTFFEMRSVDQQNSRTAHFMDVWYYVTDKTWLYFVWLFYLVVEAVCYCSSYYYYKMYSLFHQRSNRILWWGSLGLSALLNFIIVMTIA